MLKFSTFILVIFFSLQLSTKAQSPFFTKTYGDYYLNEGCNVIEMEAGKYFVLANSSVFNNTLNPVIFILGDTGQIIKKTIFPSNFIYKARKSIKLNDAYYICGITDNTTSNDYDGFVMKIDTALNIVWNKNIGTNDFWNDATAIISYGDTVFVAYSTWGEGSSNVNTKIISFNTNGDSISTFIPYLSGDSKINAMIYYNDSLIAFTGSKKSILDTVSTCFIGFMNTLTNEITTNDYFSYLGESTGNGLTKTDIGLTICGTTEKFKNTTKKDGFLLLVNADLSYHFDMVISDNNFSDDDEFLDIVKDDESNLMVTGYTKSFGLGNEDMLLYKFNAGGWYIWSHTFGSPRFDKGISLTLCSDSGFIAVGTTELNGMNNRDILVVRSNKDLDVKDNSTYVIKVPEYGSNSLVSFTNPVSNICRINFETFQTIKQISISTLDGKITQIPCLNNNQNNLELDFSNFLTGLYILKIQTSTDIYNLKVVKL